MTSWRRLERGELPGFRLARADRFLRPAAAPIARRGCLPTRPTAATRTSSAGGCSGTRASGWRTRAEENLSAGAGHQGRRDPEPRRLPASRSAATGPTSRRFPVRSATGRRAAARPRRRRDRRCRRRRRLHRPGPRPGRAEGRRAGGRTVPDAARLRSRRAGLRLLLPRQTWARSSSPRRPRWRAGEDEPTRDPTYSLGPDDERRRRLRRSTTAAGCAASTRTTSAPAPDAWSAGATRCSRRAAPSPTGRSPTTSWSRTSRGSSTTSASPRRRGQPLPAAEQALPAAADAAVPHGRTLHRGDRGTGAAPAPGPGRRQHRAVQRLSRRRPTAPGTTASAPGRATSGTRG